MGPVKAEFELEIFLACTRADGEEATKLIRLRTEGHIAVPLNEKIETRFLCICIILFYFRYSFLVCACLEFEMILFSKASLMTLRILTPLWVFQKKKLMIIKKK